MTTDAPPDDERLTALLAAFDDLLARGDTPLGSPAGVSDLASDEFTRDLAYVRLLRRAFGPVAGAGGLIGSESATSPPEGRPPTVGRFRLRRELGRGGFGVVFLAHDPALGRDIALKVPRPDALITPHLRERFLREAKAVASLDHPNVVPVYEVGEAGPVVYTASAFVDGPNLDQWLRGRTEPVSARTAARLVALLADAVRHAHDRGVLHRDLKPSNVLLVGAKAGLPRADSPPGLPGPDDPETHPAPAEELAIVPKLADFGLAQLSAPGAGEVTGPTVTGAVLGTPSYMAPEQADAGPDGVGPGADVYGLGAILYEVLTDRPPFRGETPLDTLRQVRECDPVPPRQLRPGLPRDLETICLKCLEKDPPRRYAAAADLAADLRRFLDGEPIRARPLGPAARAARWTRRNPAVAGLSLGLLVVAASALVGLTELWLRARAVAARADHERDRAEQNLDEARRAVRRHFVEVSALRLRDPGDVREFRRRQLQAAVAYFRQFLDQRPADPALRLEVAEALFLVGVLTAEIGSPEDARRTLEENAARLAELARDYPADRTYRVYLAGTRRRMAALALTTGDPAAARRQLEEVRPLVQGLLDERPADLESRVELGEFQLDLATLHWEAGELGAAREAGERGRELLERVVEDAPGVPRYRAALALAWHNAGFVRRDAGEPAAARAAFERSRAMRAELVTAHPLAAEYHRDLGRSTFQLAFTRGLLGDAPGCRTGLEEALAGQERLVAIDPTSAEYAHDLALTLSNLADAVRNAGRHADALRRFEQARAGLEGLVRTHPAVRQYRGDLAAVWQRQGSLQRVMKEFTAARHSFDEARRRQEELLRDRPDDGRTRSELGATWNNLGLVLEDLKRDPEAAVAFRTAVEHQRRVFGLNPGVRQYRVFLANHYGNLAAVCLRLSRPAEAAAAFAELQKLRPREPDTQLCVAAGLAACIPLARSGRTAADVTDPEGYGDRAIAALRQAVARGWREPAKLKTDPTFDPLRGRDDFKEILVELERPIKPER